MNMKSSTGTDTSDIKLLIALQVASKREHGRRIECLQRQRPNSFGELLAGATGQVNVSGRVRIPLAGCGGAGKCEKVAATGSFVAVPDRACYGDKLLNGIKSWMISVPDRQNKVKHTDWQFANLATSLQIQLTAIRCRQH